MYMQDIATTKKGSEIKQLQALVQKSAQEKFFFSNLNVFDFRRYINALGSIHM